MSSFIDDPNKKCRIYDSVRRICEAQSTSEDSLDHRKRRRSLFKNSRATRTASLFIDRLRNEFRRDDDFLPRFRSHRNWCPNFTSKYFCQRAEKGERALGESISKNFVLETPRVYSIGLYEPVRKRGKFGDDEERKSVIDIGDTIEYLKRCTLLGRSTSEANVPKDPPRVTITTKEILTLPSFVTTSIPLIPSIPISTNHAPNEEDTKSCTKSSTSKKRVVSRDRSESTKKDLRIHAKTSSLPNTRSFETDHRNHDLSKKRILSTEFDWKSRWSTSREDFVYCSISRKSFHKDDDQDENEEGTTKKDSISFERESTRNEVTSTDCIRCERITINIINCKTSQEFVEYGDTEQQGDDLFFEDISNSTSKSKEFFTPLGSGRQLETVSRVSYDETEILEDIRRRIDEDFERSSFKYEDYEDVGLSYDARYQDNVASWDNESFLDLEDDPLTGIDQSKSVPTITITSTNRRSSKSVTIMSSTLLEDHFYDLNSPRITLSRNTIKEYRSVESNDSEYPSYTDLSSMNSIICQSTYDFPSVCLEGTIVTSDKSHAAESFSISDVSSKQEYYESFSSRNDITCLDFTKDTENISTSSKYDHETIEEDYDRSKITDPTRDSSVRDSSMRQNKSSRYLVESIDSGVMTDVSRHDLRTYGSILEKNARCIHENRYDINERKDRPTFDFDSDSDRSDESLDRRVEMAIKKCTEDLILIERRIKIRLRTMYRSYESMEDLPACFDWSSNDERIASISTPSLVSLTDSEEL